MLNNTQLKRLCFGKIIYAPIIRSDHKKSAGSHYAIILDSNEEIIHNDTLFCVAISNNITIDSEYILPVPSSSGLKGYVICSWIAEIEKANIGKLGARLYDHEMHDILAIINQCKRDKSSGKASKSPKSGTPPGEKSS